MSKLDDILISQHTDPNYANWDTIIEHDKQQIKDLMKEVANSVMEMPATTYKEFCKKVNEL